MPENMKFELQNGKPYLVLCGYTNIPDQHLKVWKVNSAEPYVKMCGMTFHLDEKAINEMHKVMGLN